MSMKVEYKNGFKGVVSDKVAAILEKKGEVKILGKVETAGKGKKKETSGDNAPAGGAPADGAPAGGAPAQ